MVHVTPECYLGEAQKEALKAKVEAAGHTWVEESCHSSVGVVFTRKFFLSNPARLNGRFYNSDTPLMDVAELDAFLGA